MDHRRTPKRKVALNCVSLLSGPETCTPISWTLLQSPLVSFVVSPEARTPYSQSTANAKPDYKGDPDWLVQVFWRYRTC